MDLDVFFDDNFNEIDWINSVFQDDPDSKESRVSEMVIKLQDQLQSVNGLIENTSQEILTTLPKMMKDLETFSSEANLVKSKMSEIQEKIYQVDSETGSSLSNLERLESMRITLASAKQALEESDSWGRLCRELEDLMEKQDIVVACEKLYDLQRSFEAQDGLPGQTERELQLEDFKNLLEAMVGPLLVKCFESSDVEGSRKYVNIFRKMDRMPQLKPYYRTPQKKILDGQWRNVSEAMETQGNERFLKEFYDYLLENWSKQMKWCSKVFDENGILEGLIIISDLLTTLDPSREKVIDGFLKRTNEKLDFLYEISQANIGFGNEIMRKLEEAEFELSQEQKNKITRAIFEYFNTYIVKYASLEQELLNSKLDELKVMQSTSTDTIRCLESSNSKVFEWSMDCIKRCESITQNCSIISILFALSTFYRSYLDKYKKAQLQLEASRQTDHPDWNILQLAITLLENVGIIRLKLNEIEATIKNVLLKKEKQMKDEEFFCYKIFGKRDLNEFQRIIKKINESDNLANEIVIFESLLEPIVNIGKEIHHTTLASVFQPIENDFKKLEINESLTGPDLPDFSFTPMEYITLIGQYLLTLPQHLEPLLLNPSVPLKLALELSEPNYKDNIPPADILSSLVADECCVAFYEKIRKIPAINSNGAKQLATDIEYLGSILEELGLTMSSNLQQTATLLKAPSDSKGFMAAASGVDARLIRLIRIIRQINIAD